MYDLNIDKELNGDFRTSDHDDNRKNGNKEHIPTAKLRPIQKNKKNKPSSPTVKETSLKSTHAKETNEEDKDETIGTRYKKKKTKMK